MPRYGVLWACAAAITWGLVYTLDQMILESLPPATLLFIDSLLTAILVLPLVVSHGVNFTALRASSSATRLLILSSLGLALLANYFIYSGIGDQGSRRVYGLYIGNRVSMFCAYIQLFVIVREALATGRGGRLADLCGVCDCDCVSVNPRTSQTAPFHGPPRWSPRRQESMWRRQEQASSVPIYCL